MRVRGAALVLVIALVGLAFPARVAAGADPAQVGEFEIVDPGLLLTPVHAAVLHTGKVWIGTRPGNGPNDPPFGTFRSYLFDPITKTAAETQTPPWDLFCGGHVFLASGDLLIAGGTRGHPPGWTGSFERGTRKAYVFDPITETYKPLPRMREGRWYPTLVTLANGNVYTFAGKDRTGNRMNQVPEVFNVTSGSWRTRPRTDPWPMYPHLFLTRGGRLFYTGGNVFSGSLGIDLPPPGFLNQANGALSPVSGLTHPVDRDQSASVILPPAQEQRVMIMGGGVLGEHETIDNVDIIDLDAANPVYKAGPHMLYPRMHLNAVVLPDRTVFVTGGASGREMHPVLESEIYDPRADTWTAAAVSDVGRMYHSFALLLPDGRVLVGGSNPDGMEAEVRLELYSPPYLFRGPRPVITQAPGDAEYGGSVQITTTRAAEVKWVNLTRPSAVTHSMDTEQRLVNVNFRRLANGNLKLVLPGDATVAPPGWYMLTVTTRDGIPSEARWVRLG